MANLAASLQATAPANTTHRHAPTICERWARSATSRSTASRVREPTNRDNTYFAPGELNDLGNGGLKAASCANTGNPSQVPVLGRNVPCRVQPPFTWGGGILSSYYPHLTQAPLPKK